MELYEYFTEILGDRDEARQTSLQTELEASRATCKKQNNLIEQL